MAPYKWWRRPHHNDRLRHQLVADIVVLFLLDHDLASADDRLTDLAMLHRHVHLRPRAQAFQERQGPTDSTRRRALRGPMRRNLEHDRHCGQALQDVAEPLVPKKSSAAARNSVVNELSRSKALVEVSSPLRWATTGFSNKSLSHCEQAASDSLRAVPFSRNTRETLLNFKFPTASVYFASPAKAKNVPTTFVWGRGGKGLGLRKLAWAQHQSRCSQDMA